MRWGTDKWSNRSNDLKRFKFFLFWIFPLNDWNIWVSKFHISLFFFWILFVASMRCVKLYVVGVSHVSNCNTVESLKWLLMMYVVHRDRWRAATSKQTVSCSSRRRLFKCKYTNEIKQKQRCRPVEIENKNVENEAKMCNVHVHLVR